MKSKGGRQQTGSRRPRRAGHARPIAIAEQTGGLTVPSQWYTVGTRRIGFRAARRRLCEALQDPSTIIHEERSHQEEKNLIATGEVTPIDLLEVARAANGNDYQEAPHHQDASVVVHIIEREHQGVAWYIKWYCLEPNVVFISVHH
jgi:hypothetical protein